MCEFMSLTINGVEVYDAFSMSTFNLRAILMWTINDFPAFGNMSGWPTKGRFACPVCRKGTCAEWLPHSRKFAYMGHRRFLPFDHPFRKKLAWFNNKHEKGVKPKLFTSEEIFWEVGNLVNDFGKASKKRKRRKQDKHSDQLWKKRSIFFDLPYWKVHFAIYYVLYYVILLNVMIILFFPSFSSI